MPNGNIFFYVILLNIFFYVILLTSFLNDIHHPFGLETESVLGKAYADQCLAGHAPVTVNQDEGY